MFDEVFQKQNRKTTTNDDEGKGDKPMNIIGWIGGIIGSGFGIGKIFTAFKALSKLKKLKRIVKEIAEAIKEGKDVIREADETYYAFMAVVKKVQADGIDSISKEEYFKVINEGKDVFKEVKEFAKEAQDVIDVIKA